MTPSVSGSRSAAAGLRQAARDRSGFASGAGRAAGRAGVAGKAGLVARQQPAGHVTEEMTEHYSHVDRAEKLRAADKVVSLERVGITGCAVEKT